MASAPVIASFAANDPADLLTALNAYLAGLTNPIVNGIDIEVVITPRQLGRPYSVLVVTQTGGSSIATPWIVAIYEANTLAAAAASAAAFVTANPGYFYPAVKQRSFYIGAGAQTPRVAVIQIYNATSGASANWLPT